MDFQFLVDRAISVRKLYTKFELQNYGKSWTTEDIALGFVGDVGDLVKLVMAESGIREIPGSKKKFEHELSDCLWSIIVLADIHKIDLENSFLRTMNEIEKRIST